MIHRAHCISRICKQTAENVKTSFMKSQFFFSLTEIGKVRGNLFQINGKKQDPLVLPDAAGPPVTLSEKVYVPIKEYPDVSTYPLCSRNFQNVKLRLDFVNL